MSSFRAFAFIALSFFVAGCGLTGEKEKSMDDIALPVVEAADGSLYSIPCLREIAPKMEAQGRGAMEQCRVGVGNDLNARGAYRSSCYKGCSTCSGGYPCSMCYYCNTGCSGGSCGGSSCGGSSCGGSSCGGSSTNCAYNYAYVYYPPTYYSQQYYDPYYSQASYNPYKSYQYTTPFCGYVFGSSYASYNCYYILGYGAQSYTNYYKSSCSPCSSGYCGSTSSCWNTRPMPTPYSYGY